MNKMQIRAVCVSIFDLVIHLKQEKQTVPYLIRKLTLHTHYSADKHLNE